MIESDLPTPFYIVYEDKLRANLERIVSTGDACGADIIMAFKANALWKTFDIVREYCRNCTASSVNELMLGVECLGGEIHAFSPAYTESNIDIYLKHCTHITFNSLSQFERFKDRVADSKVSAALRVNPRCSVVETDLYNPALPGSRFGVEPEALAGGVPRGIEGLHFHALCESDSKDLKKVLEAFENNFGFLLPDLKWVNFGGGHLITRKDYDIPTLIEVITGFKDRHPNLRVIMEPGSAFTWQTGNLVASVVDIVQNAGITTAILDVSFACHMPDTLEMPYRPAVLEEVGASKSCGIAYRLGGNSCLSGDFIGDYYFEKPLRIGDRITLLDMNHYTTVKTTMFNGIPHPDIVLCRKDGECQYLRRFDYSDYKSRMC